MEGWAHPPSDPFDPERPLPFYRRLAAWARDNQRRLAKLRAGESAEERRELCDSWFRYMLYNERAMRAIHRAGDRQVHPLAHCFVEYQRAMLIEQYPRLRAEASQNALNPSQGAPQNSSNPSQGAHSTTSQRAPNASRGLLSFSLSESAQLGTWWRGWGAHAKPVYGYTMTEVVQAVARLIEPDGPEPCEDLWTLHQVLVLRSGSFWCETMHPKDVRSVFDHEDFIDREDVDEERKRALPNFRYAVYMAIYLFPMLARAWIYRRWMEHAKPLYDDVLGPSPAEVASVERWFRNRVVRSMGNTALFDVHEAVCREHYAIPGDAEWHQFRYPERGGSLVAVLRTLRPHQAELYESEAHLTPDVLLGRLDESERGRLLVLRMVGRYFSTGAHRFCWDRCMLVRNTELSQQDRRMLHSPHPLVVQLYSRFLVMLRRSPMIRTSLEKDKEEGDGRRDGGDGRREGGGGEGEQGGEGEGLSQSIDELFGSPVREEEEEAPLRETLPMSVFWVLAAWFKLLENGGVLGGGRVDISREVREALGA